MNIDDYKKILGTFLLTPQADKVYMSGEVVQRLLLGEEDLGEDLEAIIDFWVGREKMAKDLCDLGFIPRVPRRSIDI